MTYQRNGRVTQTEESPMTPPLAQKTAEEEKSIKVDGFGQVIAMLRHADPEFRQSLLKRLLREDPRMGAKLQAALRNEELDN